MFPFSVGTTMLPSIQLVFCISIISLSQVNSDGNVFPRECRLCKPGYYAVKKCNEHHDTVCAPCPTGKYMPDRNIADVCRSCSECAQGFFSIKQCNGRHDTICSSCDELIYQDLSSYKKICLSGMVSDEVPKSSNEGNIDVVNLETGSGDDSGIILEPETELVPTSIAKTTHKSSDVHATITPEPDNVHIQTENETDEIEASGDFPSIEITTDNDTDLAIVSSPEPVSKSTTSPLPSSSTLSSSSSHIDITEEGFIPAKNYTTNIPSSTTTITTTTTTTGEPDIPLPEPIPDVKSSEPPSTIKTSSVSVKSSTIRITQQPTISSSIQITESSTSPQPTTTTTATAVKTLPPIGGGGIILPDGGDDNGGDYIITPIPPEGTTPKKDTRKRPSADAITVEMSDGNDNVTIGVVVAVAIVAAILFFILGFIVSRYCRRNRGSFQVMRKAEDSGHKNGATILNGSRDPEKETGIYDEIGRETVMTPNGSADRVVPVAVDDVYAVPDKRPKNNNGSPKMDEQLNVIKFIDETTDDELDAKEGDRLLEDNDENERERHASRASIPNGSVRHSKDLDREDEMSPLVENEDKDSSSSDQDQPLCTGEEESNVANEEQGETSELTPVTMDDIEKHLNAES